MRRKAPNGVWLLNHSLAFAFVVIGELSPQEQFIRVLPFPVTMLLILWLVCCAIDIPFHVDTHTLACVISDF
jgi:hypothetical protein